MVIRWVRRSDRCFRNEGEGAARHTAPLLCRCGGFTTPSASSDRIPFMNDTSTWIRGLLAVALVAACPSLRAASFTWDGEGASPTWGTADVHFQLRRFL